jgi:hypothetical protein
VTVALAAMSLGATTIVASSTASADDSGAATKIVQCESGIVTQGDVQTSSLVVDRVPADAPTPGGCTVAGG